LLGVQPEQAIITEVQIAQMLRSRRLIEMRS
jgi:hypothetical protein